MWNDGQSLGRETILEVAVRGLSNDLDKTRAFMVSYRLVLPDIHVLIPDWVKLAHRSGQDQGQRKTQDEADDK